MTSVVVLPDLAQSGRLCALCLHDKEGPGPEFDKPC